MPPIEDHINIYQVKQILTGIKGEIGSDIKTVEDLKYPTFINV